MYKQAYYFYFEVEKVAEEEKNREPESDVESDKVHPYYLSTYIYSFYIYRKRHVVKKT